MALLLAAIVLFMPMVVRRIKIRTAAFAVTPLAAVVEVSATVMGIGTVVAAKMILLIGAMVVVEVVCRQLYVAAFVSTATRVIISTVMTRVIVLSITITMAFPRMLRIMCIEIRLVPRVLRMMSLEIRVVVPGMVSIVPVEVLHVFWIEAVIGVVAATSTISSMTRTLVPVATVASTVSTITMRIIRIIAAVFAFFAVTRFVMFLAVVTISMSIPWMLRVIWIEIGLVPRVFRIVEIEFRIVEIEFRVIWIGLMI